MTGPEDFQRHRPDSGQATSLGTRKSAFLAGGLLIAIGALITLVVSMFAGITSPGRLVGPPTLVEPSPASALLQTPLRQAELPAPASAPVKPGPTPAQPTLAPAPSTAQQARVVRDQAFGDWRFVCVQTGDAAANCSAIQQLRVAETGAAVFVWRIVQDGRGGLVGVWQVPETVLHAAGLLLDAGTPQPVAIPFEMCGDGSCQAVANLTPAFIEKLSSARTLSASVIQANRKPLKFPVSSTGLIDAIRALSQ